MEEDYQRRYVDCVRKIEEMFKSTTNVGREFLLSDLEKLERERAESFFSESGFNYQLAQFIREKQGINQTILARMFQMKQVEISAIERGKKVPKNKGYLKWLSENGYDFKKD